MVCFEVAVFSPQARFESLNEANVLFLFFLLSSPLRAAVLLLPSSDEWKMIKIWSRPHNRALTFRPALSHSRFTPLL